MSPPPARLLLLLPLLLTGCLSAGYPATRLGDDDAAVLRFPRVSSRAVEVQAAQPAHAAFLEIHPGADTVARWVDGAGSRPIETGRHAVALADAAGFASGRGPCSPGERAYYGAQQHSVREILPLGDVRAVGRRGRAVYCIRDSGAPLTADTRRHVVVIVAPAAADPGALEQAVAAFNERHAASPAPAETLVRALAEAVAQRWPGSAIYHVRPPAPR